jgi:inositol 1,4,5-triphosphate receptor-associated cGMP kinase
LSLAFKTDKFTLEQRLKLQKHQRDVAEQDALNEIQSLRDSIRHLNQMILCFDEKQIINMRSEMKEFINKIETQVEVIGQTNAKICSRSELYGAVKQEERVSAAFDVILMYTENLKRLKEKDEKELEETKKLLNSSSYRKIECESDSENDSHSVRRSVRSISTANMPKMVSLLSF